MKKLLKITLTLVITIIVVTGIILPEIILGTPASLAVGNWYQQFIPNLNGRQIVDITFLDNLTGYAISSRLTVSDSSLILKTTNSGDNWFTLYSPTGYIFKKVQFMNQNTGYVGGTGLLKTTNSGINWSVVNNSVTLEDMYFTGNDTGWYAYSESLTGGVFRTTNGGTNWVRQLDLGSQNPEKIYMFNARIGFITRNNSGIPAIRKTTNSGLNWSVIYNSGFADIHFTDSLNGWLAYDSVKKTTDGGLNWQTQILPYGTYGGGFLNYSYINQFSFINKDTIFGVGGRIAYPNTSLKGLIYRTTNGGQNWLFQLPDTGLGNAQFLKVQFINKSIGWAYRGYEGIHTTNSGDPVWLTEIVQTSTEIPNAFKLYQNYPNPFNPNTKIKFHLLKQGNAEIIIFDINGRKIQNLLNEELIAGEYEIDFNAAGLATGTYFYKLTVTTGKEVFTDTKKMVLIK